jgi:hypothetical protein
MNAFVYRLQLTQQDGLNLIAKIRVSDSMLYFQTEHTTEQGIKIIIRWLWKEAFLERRRIFNVVEYYSRMEARILGMIPRR